MAEFLKILNDDRLFPVTVKEQSPSGLVDRIGFQSSGGEWNLIFLGHRFDFSRRKTATIEGDFGDFSDFCREASTRLITGLNYFGRKAHRLSAVQEGLLPEMSNQGIDDIAKRLLKLPSIFSANFPHEWDWRSVSFIQRSFGDLSEPTNTIAIMKRRSGVFRKAGENGNDEQPLNRVFFEFDINTLPDNTKARFGAEEVTSFFEQISAWHSQLSDEIFSFIHGSNEND